MSLQDPKAGFVSLGCPKALADSGRRLTQRRMQGYDIDAQIPGTDSRPLREPI